MNKNNIPDKEYSLKTLTAYLLYGPEFKLKMNEKENY
jgi:hypothetical protein